MALKRVGVEMVAENAAAFDRALQSAERSVKDFGHAADASSSQIGGWEQIVIGGLRRVGAAAVDLSIQGGRALIGLVGDTLSAAGDFEATLNNFSSKTGSAMEEAGFDLQDFSAEFLRLGAETKFSAAEAGDAAVELAKGGVSVTDIMGEATAATLDLAAAADLELAPAAEIVAKQLGVWADQGVTATDVVDNLAQAANASTVDVDQLALGLANVGGVAKVAGLSFDETVTTLAMLAPNFSSAADAGTSFKTFLSRLIPTTADATSWMLDLGLYSEETGSRFYDATGSFIGMEAASALLFDTTKGLNEELKIQAFQAIFGADAIRAAALIAENGADGYNAMGLAMTNAGTAAEQAAKMNVGYNAAMSALGGSLDTVQIILGTLLLPTLTAFVETAVIPAVNAVGDFATALGTSNDPMAMIVEQLKLGASMLSTWVIDAIPSVIGGLATLGAALIEWVVSMLPTWGAAMLELGQQAAQWISDSLPGWQAAAAEYLNGLIAWVQASLPGWIENLKTLGAAAAQWIADSMPGWLEKASELFNAMIAWIAASLPGWIENLKAFANAAIQWVLDALPGLGTNLGAFAGAILAWIVKTTGEAIPVIAGLAATFVSWVWTDVLPALPGALLTIATAIYNFIAEVAAAVVPELVKLAEKFYIWVTDTVLPALPGVFAAVWDAISSWIGTAATDAYNAVITIGTNIIAGITQGVTDAAGGLLDAVIGAVNDTLNAVGDFLGIQSPSTLMRDFIGRNMMEGLAEGISMSAYLAEQALIQAMRMTTQTAIGEAASGGVAIGESLTGQFNMNIQAGMSNALGMLADQSAQGGWAAGNAFASAYQSAISGLAGGGSLIDMPSLSGGFSSGNTSTTNNSANYAINYNGVSSPPPPSQSFAALAAWAG